MKKITFDNMSDILIEVLPELKSKYNKELEWWGGEKPGAHNIYGNILNPYIIELLKREKDKDILERIFDFLEELSLNPDIHVQEVVVVTVLERLFFEGKEVYEKARKYMKLKTLNFSYELEDWWIKFAEKKEKENIKKGD